MRIRSIKPEFWQHPVLSRLPDDVRLAAIGVISISDDEGYFVADPASVRSALWPYDEDSTRTRRALARLVQVGFVAVCEHPERGQIGRVVNFRKHQKIDRPSPSKIACYYSSNPRREIDDRSSLDQGSGIRDQGSSSPLPPKHVEEEKTPSSESIQQAESILAIWPKKIDPTAALAAILRAVRRDGFERVRAGTIAIADADRRRNGTTSPPGRFLPRPAEFFDASRYLDDPEQYGPRTASADPTELRRQIDDLSRMLVEHPGNPDNLEGSLDRKASHRDEFRDLKRVISEKRAALAELLKGQEAEQ